MDPNSSPSTSMPVLRQLTPVLIVERVEPCLDFWTRRFGFAVTNEVPGAEGALVFASVSRDGIEVMYQTRASVIADDPSSASDINGHSVALFIAVDNIDDVERAIDGVPIVKARHETFYGSTEIYVREPGGNTVGFAQFTQT